MVIFLCLTCPDFSLGFAYQISVLLSLSILSVPLLPLFRLHYIFIVFLPRYQDKILIQVSLFLKQGNHNFFKSSFLEKKSL